MFRQTHMEPNQTFRQVQAPVPSNVVDHGTSNTFSHAFILLLRLILLYIHIIIYIYNYIYIIINIYVCVCVWFSRSFKTWHPQLQWIIIFSLFSEWRSFGMAVWSPSHWHTTDASLAGPLPWNWEMGRVLKGPKAYKVSLGPKDC